MPSCRVTVDLHRKAKLSDLCPRRSLLHRERARTQGPPESRGRGTRERDRKKVSCRSPSPCTTTTPYVYQEKNIQRTIALRSDVDPAYGMQVVCMYGKCVSGGFFLVQGMLCFLHWSSYPEMINRWHIQISATFMIHIGEIQDINSSFLFFFSRCFRTHRVSENVLLFLE